MSSRIEKFASIVSERKGQKHLLETQLEDKTAEIEKSEALIKDLEKAKWVLTEVASLTQKKFKSFVESLITKAISSVYDRPFKFILQYGKKAGKTTIQPLIQEGDNAPEIPKDDGGVGMLDLISVSFRFIFKKLERPQCRNFMWLDEPMRDIGKGKLLDRSANFLREMSKRLHIQLIINTHEPELARIGDRTFYVEHNGVHAVVSKQGHTEPDRVVVKKKRSKLTF